MGGDGGCKISRDLIVTQQKRKQISQDSVIVNHGRYTNCAMSGLQLTKPLAICELGYIYNRDVVVEYLTQLLQYKDNPLQFSLEQRILIEDRQETFPHITKLTDITTLNAKTLLMDYIEEKDAVNTTLSVRQKSLFPYLLCPIVNNLPADGSQQFIVMQSCGCLLSKKGYEQLHGDLYKVAVKIEEECGGGEEKNKEEENKDKKHNVITTTTKTIKLRGCAVCQAPLPARFQDAIGAQLMEKFQAQQDALKEAQRKAKHDKKNNNKKDDDKKNNDNKKIKKADQVVAVEKAKKLTPNDLPLQDGELPYIPLIPTPDQHDVLRAVLNKKRVLLGRGTIDEEMKTIKKQRLNVVQLEKDKQEQAAAEKLVQLAPILGVQKK